MSLSWNHGCQMLLLRDEDYVQSVIKQESVCVHVCVCVHTSVCVCVRACKHNPRGCICNLRAHSLMPRCLLSLTRHYGLSVAILPVMTSSCSPQRPMVNLWQQLTCCAFRSNGTWLVRKQSLCPMFDHLEGRGRDPSRPDYWWVCAVV